MAAAGDWEGLRMLAHQLKGSGTSFGFDAITILAAEAEGKLKEGDIAGARGAVQALVAYMTGVDGYEQRPTG